MTYVMLILYTFIVSQFYSTLNKPIYYPYIKDEVEVHGESIFWQLQENQFWKRIDSICSDAIYIVGTLVLDLPMFDREPVISCWGTISYEIDGKQLQIPVPLIQLSTAETINNSCMKLLEENEHSAILSLKSTSSIERIINIRFSRIDDWDMYKSKKKQLFHFLTKKSFEKIYNNIFLVKTHGPLMYCLVEILSTNVDNASIRICSRSVNQMNIILHLLQDDFPNVTVVEEVNNYVEAAMALIRELEMIRDKKSAIEIEKAKLITDLYIP